MRYPELRVKIKNLAEEARIIRKEEKRFKALGQYEKLNSLHFHRVVEVRRVARHALLAYGFMRGRAFKQLEDHRKPFAKLPTVKLVAKDVRRFCTNTDLDLENIESLIQDWIAGKLVYAKLEKTE